MISFISKKWPQAFEGCMAVKDQNCVPESFAIDQAYRQCGKIELTISSKIDLHRVYVIVLLQIYVPPCLEHVIIIVGPGAGPVCTVLVTVPVHGPGGVPAQVGPMLIGCLLQCDIFYKIYDRKIETPVIFTTTPLHDKANGY